MPPSPPICRIEGEAAYFHNITLTCKSEEGSPKPVTEWKTYSTENTPRPFPPKTTESMPFISSLILKYVSLVRQSLFPYSYWHFLAYFFNLHFAEDGALYLFNISRETSGFFVCTSTNEIGSNHCNLTLAVMPGKCLVYLFTC